MAKHMSPAQRTYAVKVVDTKSMDNRTMVIGCNYNQL